MKHFYVTREEGPVSHLVTEAWRELDKNFMIVEGEWVARPETKAMLDYLQDLAYDKADLKGERLAHIVKRIKLSELRISVADSLLETLLKHTKDISEDLRAKIEVYKSLKEEK